MVHRGAERSARSWWVVCTMLFQLALATAPRLAAPSRWLAPVFTGLTAVAWFRIWRHRRRTNDGTLDRGSR